MSDKQPLSISHPHLENEWDMQTNGINFKETPLTPGSDKEVHWKCKEHQHSWSTPLSRRTATTPPPKCPVCSNKTVLTGFNDLESQNPTLAKEYSPKNPTPPNSINIGSHTAVTWECSKGHEWETSVKSRNSSNSGCPICKNKKVLPGFNDLTTTHPELAKQWHPTKNGELQPEHFTAGSKTKIWWQCTKGHESFSPIYAKKKQPPCSKCAGNIKEAKNIISIPSLNKKWDTIKNLPFTAETTLTNNKNEFWWTLENCGHSWKSKISPETNRKECPICTNRIIQAGVNDLATTHPEIATAMANQQPEDITPQTITSAYPKHINLECPLGHTWKNKPIQLREKTNPTKCPTCEGYQLLTGFNDLTTTHPELAKQWHPTKNGELQPSQITYKNLTKTWWQCQACNYKWQASPSYRANTQAGCRSCARQTVTPGFNDLATTNPELAKQWHSTKNGKLKPTDITSKSTAYNIWWRCDKGHEWQAKPGARTSNGRGCPVCSNQSVLLGFNDAATTHPELINLLHSTKNSKNILKEHTAGSGIQPWWRCDNGHEWQAYLYAVSAGSRCPKCANSVSNAEQEIADYLTQQLPSIDVQTSVRGVIGNKTELDIYIPEKNIAIDFNGLYWHDENHGKTKWWHQQKYLACKEQNIQLIQIWEDDWNERKEFIKLALLHKLQEADPTLRVGARKLTPAEINYQQASQFLNANHIQGDIQGTKYYALQTKDKGDIKAVLVIKKVGNKGHEGEWRIERYATSCPVPGGFTKLLKHAENQIKQEKQTITKWVTFSDNCISDGGLYANNGFTKDSELEPDYMYVKNIKRIHKFNYRLKRFKEDPQLKWQPGLSESQLAKLNKLPRIWDAGKIRWVKKVS